MHYHFMYLESTHRLGSRRFLTKSSSSSWLRTLRNEFAHSHAGERVRVFANGAIRYRIVCESVMIRVVVRNRSNFSSDIITRAASRTTSVW